MKDNSILPKLESGSCVALRYVNEEGQPTMEYPLNPNGSMSKTYFFAIVPFKIKKLCCMLKVEISLHCVVMFQVLSLVSAQRTEDTWL